MKRLNITLPNDIAEFLQKKSNKSRYIAKVIYEKAEREKKEQLQKLLSKGYSEERIEGQALNEEWEPTTLDLRK